MRSRVFKVLCATTVWGIMGAFALSAKEKAVNATEIGRLTSFQFPHSADTMMVWGSNGKKYDFYTLLKKERPNLVFIFTAANCNSCVHQAFLEMQSYFRDNPTKKLVVLTNIPVTKKLRLYEMKYRFNFSIYSTKGDLKFDNETIEQPSFYKIDEGSPVHICTLSSANKNAIAGKCKYTFQQIN